MNVERNELNDPYGDIVRSLHERDEVRKQAIELAWQQYEASETDSDRRAAINNVARMLQVADEFTQLFPETFPAEENNN
jgi:hypothetical protein